MLFHISRSAAVQSLYRLEIFSDNFSDCALEQRVKDEFLCDVLVYKDLYVDDFLFGMHVADRLNSDMIKALKQKD